jgi:hypothetical protein
MAAVGVSLVIVRKDGESTRDAAAPRSTCHVRETNVHVVHRVGIDAFLNVGFFAVTVVVIGLVVLDPAAARGGTDSAIVKVANLVRKVNDMAFGALIHDIVNE